MTTARSTRPDRLLDAAGLACIPHTPLTKTTIRDMAAGEAEPLMAITDAEPTKLGSADPTTSNYADLKSILTDTESDRPTRLRRLQGWRGADLDAAVLAGNAHRIAPATCAALALIVAFTASLPLAVIALASAIIGVFAPHHPIESAYNMIARRRGGRTLPANRAAKRLGCLIGAMFFAAASTAFVLNYELAGQIIAGVMAAVAAFVAVTDICVPSLIYTLVFGKSRAACPLIAVRIR